MRSMSTTENSTGWKRYSPATRRSTYRRIRKSSRCRPKGRRRIREVLEGRYDVVSKVDQRRHLITNLVIDELGGDEAVTRCFLTVLSVPKSGGSVELRGTGVYHDRLRRIDGSWLIAERRLVLDALGT